jgi:endo-1,4-beta-D-glucanase Y
VNELRAFRAAATAPLLLVSLVLSTQCALKPQSSVAPVNTSAQNNSGGAAPITAGNGGLATVAAAGTTNAGGASTSGAGGASGSLANGGSAGMAEVLGPTPATAGVNFPFPQNRQSQLCTYPKYHNSDVVAAYQRWKTDTVTATGAGNHLRVQRPEDTGVNTLSTVSEGIGYGMVIAVYMNDQTLFDGLWQYEQLWLGMNGLMDWRIAANGTDRLGTGAATDADEDMAWALLMADRQWGGSGTLGDTYLNIAKKQIGLIYTNEIYMAKLVKPGDTWGDWTTVNASYFAPAYYRAFATASGNSGWNDVVKTSYDTLANTLNTANGNSNNGLVPAWATSDGVPNAAVFMNMPAAPTNYQYDSCRTPFRIGLDYCMNSEMRAQLYVSKTSQFFSGIGAKNIVDGYQLNGTPEPQSTSGQSAAFVGPAAVGAMSFASYLGFIQDAYDAVATQNLLVGGKYYDESWTVLSLLMLTGNFVDYTAVQPLTK